MGGAQAKYNWIHMSPVVNGNLRQLIKKAGGEVPPLSGDYRWIDSTWQVPSRSDAWKWYLLLGSLLIAITVAAIIVIGRLSPLFFRPRSSEQVTLELT